MVGVLRDNAILRVVSADGREDLVRVSPSGHLTSLLTGTRSELGMLVFDERVGKFKMPEPESMVVEVETITEH